MNVEQADSRFKLRIVVEPGATLCVHYGHAKGVYSTDEALADMGTFCLPIRVGTPKRTDRVLVERNGIGWFKPFKAFENAAVDILHCACTGNHLNQVSNGSGDKTGPKPGYFGLKNFLNRLVTVSNRN